MKTYRLAKHKIKSTREKSLTSNPDLIAAEGHAIINVNIIYWYLWFISLKLSVLCYTENNNQI